MSKRKKWAGRIYLGRDSEGRQQFEWLGRFDTRRERDDAVAARRTQLREGEGGPGLPPVTDYVDRYLAEYARTHKHSSVLTQQERLRRFKRDFDGRTLAIGRQEAKDWADTAPAAVVAAVVTLYNHAIDDDDLPIGRNPFRKLSRRSKGRSEEPPPTPEEFERLLDACSVLKAYGPMMRAVTKFAAFTLMRPGELYPLEWPDIDMDRMRIRKARRVYRGSLDVPKTGEKLIALTPPARDAILGLLRDGALVFRSKTGKRLSQGMMSLYWGEVCARADLDFDFYHATKHYGVWTMWTQLGMSSRAIAAQAGWSPAAVEKMLRVYGHGDVGALEEVDAAFRARENVVRLRKVEDA